MSEYFIPTGESESEFVEKRSRFIGHVWRVETEAEARGHIESMKKRYHDARHNCWCYRLKEGGIERYSDDGEPQGTAGQPILNVFQRQEITNVCCVVTRYFGGILLGAGGLVRAYTQGAKDAMDAAGTSVVRCWTAGDVTIPYGLFEQMKLAVEQRNGVVTEVDYAADVTLHILLPEGGEAEFANDVVELSSGTTTFQFTGELWRDVPL